MSSRVLDAGSINDLSIWDLPLVSEGDEPVVVANAEKLLPTAKDIEDIQRQAYEEAYQEAYKKGHEEGQLAGKEKGYEEGLLSGKQDGYKQAYEEGQGQITEKAATLESLINTLATPMKLLDEDVENELMALVVNIARHLIRREIKSEPSHVIAAVRQAVELLPISARKIRVFLHPDDATLVKESLAYNDDDEVRWKIVEDPMLSRGGCNVETEHSRIDATVESRLNKLIAQILGGVRESDNVADTDSQPE